MKGSSKLSERQRRFVDAYVGVSAGNLTEAALRAGYSQKSAKSIGSELALKPKIAQAIAARQAALSRKVDVTQARLVEELAYVGFSNVRDLFDDQGQLRPMRELPEHVTRAIASVEVDSQGVRKIRLWPKADSLKLAAQILGFLRDRVDVHHFDHVAYLREIHDGAEMGRRPS